MERRSPPQFGKNLRRYRKCAGITQEELAFRASMHLSDVGLIERGRREPRLGNVVKLAVALHVSVNDLLGGIEWKPGRRGGGRFELPG